MAETSPEIRVLRLLCILVPGDIRHDFEANLVADHKQRLEERGSRWRAALGAARQLVTGFAQYAPLQPSITGRWSKPEVAARSAAFGRSAWTLSGPLLFAGVVFDSVPLIITGAALVLVAFGLLVTVTATARDPLPERQSRFVAAVLGGTVATLALVFVCAFPLCLLLAVASALDLAGLVGSAIHALIFVATAALAGVTGSAWVPEEWSPSRLVDIRKPAEEAAEEVAEPAAEAS